MNPITNIIEVYTDGATSKNGTEEAIGGWAYAIIENEQCIITNSGWIDKATNNICELTAIINACKYIKENILDNSNCNIVLYSDSAYVINCYKDKWYKKWIANGWINSKKEPVANKELWEKLIPFFENSRFTFEKVKGHSTNKYNNYVDKLAVIARSKNG